jgi:LysR family cyn operon transcriptional activator
MELRQLKYFAEVSRRKSFSEASKALFITQSTLSQQIQKLEEELGVELLTRDTRHVELSDYGTQFLPCALQILQDAQAGIDKIKDAQNLMSGELRVGSTYSFDPLLYKTALGFHKRYPHIKLLMHSSSKEVLLKMLTDRELDIVLAYKSYLTDERIMSHPLFNGRLSLIMARRYAPDSTVGIELDSLPKYPLALPSKGLQARDALDLMLSTHNISLDIRFELNNLHGILSLVRNSRLATILSGEVVSNADAFAAIPINHHDARMDGCYHYLKNTYQKKSAEVFIDMLKENNAFNLAGRIEG